MCTMRKSSTIIYSALTYCRSHVSLHSQKSGHVKYKKSPQACITYTDCSETLFYNIFQLKDSLARVWLTPILCTKLWMDTQPHWDVAALRAQTLDFVQMLVNAYKVHALHVAVSCGYDTCAWLANYSLTWLRREWIIILNKWPLLPTADEVWALYVCTCKPS